MQFSNMQNNTWPIEGFVLTDNSDIMCTELPVHWKANKKLPKRFTVVAKKFVPDYTNVIVSACNEVNLCCEMRNFFSHMYNNVAIFNDLRFIGYSGRGKTFRVTIGIYTEIRQIGTCKGTIKITANGPPRDQAKNLHCTCEKLDSRLVNMSDDIRHVPPYVNTNNLWYRTEHEQNFGTWNRTLPMTDTSSIFGAPSTRNTYQTNDWKTVPTNINY